MFKYWGKVNDEVVEYNYNISSHHFRHAVSPGFLGDLGNVECLKNIVGAQDFYAFYIAQLHEHNFMYADYCNH